MRAIALLGLALVLLASPAPGEQGQPPAVDLSQKRVSDNGVTAPLVRGGMARLTLDPHLDRAAERLLRAADPVAGALVVADARTGKLLALAETSRDGRHGALTSAKAPAASVFKIVTTAALLETTELTPRDQVCTLPSLRSIQREHLDAPPRSAAECVPFGVALGHSKNAVFARLAVLHLLRTDLVEVAERLGFNALAPFDFKVPVGKLEVPYNDLEFARTAAGFRGSTLSPLGAVHLASVIAQRGEAIRLRVIEEAGSYRAEPEAERLGALLSRRTAERIAKMMEVTVTSGTSRAAFTDEEGRSYLPGIRVAGKTGTLKPPHETVTTSWFMGFAPAENPELVISVLLQNGATFRRKANEVARDMLRVAFRARGRARVSDPFEKPSGGANAISMVRPAP
jgi:peptidoglycan glycosyltransferase